MCTRDAAPGARAKGPPPVCFVPVPVPWCCGLRAAGAAAAGPAAAGPAFLSTFLAFSSLRARPARAPRAAAETSSRSLAARAGPRRRTGPRGRAVARASLSFRPPGRCSSARPRAGGRGCGASNDAVVTGSLRALRKIQDDVTGDVGGIGTTLPPPRGPGSATGKRLSGKRVSRDPTSRQTPTNPHGSCRGRRYCFYSN